MAWVDFSIFHAKGSYGHANGNIDVSLTLAPGASIDLSHLVPLPLPSFFPGRVHVELVLPGEAFGALYSCSDVCVESHEDAQVLGAWLDQVPGLSVWPNDRDDPLFDSYRHDRGV